MKVVLDTSYLFPVVNVNIVEGWSKLDLMQLLQNSRLELSYCDLSLFEIYTKSMKLINQNKIPLEIEQVQKGIQAILQSSSLHKLSWYENIFESDIILKLKSLHNDSIDGIIFYLAVVDADIFATFDKTLINRINGDTEIRNFVKDVNPDLKIWYQNLKEDPIPFLI